MGGIPCAAPAARGDYPGGGQDALACGAGEGKLQRAAQCPQPAGRWEVWMPGRFLLPSLRLLPNGRSQRRGTRRRRGQGPRASASGAHLGGALLQRAGDVAGLAAAAPQPARGALCHAACGRLLHPARQPGLGHRQHRLPPGHDARGPLHPAAPPAAAPFPRVPPEVFLGLRAAEEERPGGAPADAGTALSAPGGRLPQLDRHPLLRCISYPCLGGHSGHRGCRHAAEGSRRALPPVG
mmetsp:Transcript_28360/g.67466  ORF Transcript_28360/g.67466 Transcript_28360/m.67466 type:complete len:238 (+) Transcript_28360:2779-3492(+)